MDGKTNDNAKTNDKSQANLRQANLRQDGMGTEGIGEGGDAGLGGSATEANSRPDTHQAEGAFGAEGGAHGRRSPANKQGPGPNVQGD